MDSKEQIQNYLKEILEINKHLNLTAIRDINEARLLHIEDSLTALSELQSAPEGIYVDMGTGGGFPGVPLALSSGRETILVDSVKKKIAAIECVLKQLPFTEHISVYPGRIEDFSKIYQNKIAVITARALASLSVIMELATPLLIKKGLLICFKAKIDNEEFNHAQGLQKVFGLEIVTVKRVVLSDQKTTRTLIVLKKKEEPSIRLPRRVGEAQKKPF